MQAHRALLKDFKKKKKKCQKHLLCISHGSWQQKYKQPLEPAGWQWGWRDHLANKRFREQTLLVAAL